MPFVNVTPHVLNIHTPDGGVVNVPPSGVVARVDTTSEVVEVTPEGVTVSRTAFGAVTGLPDPQEGVIIIASLIVASAARRGDVVSPGALVRGPDGQPIGCQGLSRPV